MSMNNITEQLNHRLGNNRWRMVSIDRLEELSGEIVGRYQQGKIAPEVYRAYINDFQLTPPVEASGAKSILIVASVQPQFQVGFTKGGKVHNFVIPPTYLHHTDDEVSQVLEDILSPGGYWFKRAWIPEKLLAARSGLARYGRNNIAYVDGLGSFFRPRPFYTDLPVIHDHWRPAELMEACGDCSGCIAGCPTGALGGNGFAAQADKCITFYNELPVQWPQWVESNWDLDSKCIVGCMKCQIKCPQNKKNKDWLQPTETFSEKETQELLQCKEEKDLSTETLQKMDRLYLTEYIPTISRNLTVLFNGAA